MKIQNNELEPFILHLRSLNLEHDMTGSRMRTRLVKLLLSHYEEIMNEVGEVNLKYTKKNDDGTIYMENEIVQFTDPEARKKELFEIGNEFTIIEQNEANKQMLLSVRESVINIIPFELKGVDAELYDEFCELVEQIKYEET